MRAYPDIWMSVIELQQVFDQCRESRIPIKEVLRAVNGRIKDKKAQGIDPSKISAFSWSIGWAREQVIRIENEKTKLAKNRDRP